MSGDVYLDLIMKAFETAGLPEVNESQLEAGTYTNAQLAEKMRGDPGKLIHLLMNVSTMGNSPAAKRSILSIAVDMIDEKEQ